MPITMANHMKNDKNSSGIPQIIPSIRQGFCIWTFRYRSVSNDFQLL